MTASTGHRYDGPLRREKGERKRAYATRRAGWGMPIADRIRLHTKTDPATGCWVWQLALVPVTGYGSLTVDGTNLRAHRASYEAFVGPIPDGLQIDHLCRNRACVNPEHLEPVTPEENNRRAPSCHGRKTHCPRGHEYSEANTYAANGRRYCRTCQVAYRELRKAIPAAEVESRRAAGLPIVDLDAHFATQSSEEAA